MSDFHKADNTSMGLPQAGGKTSTYNPLYSTSTKTSKTSPEADTNQNIVQRRGEKRPWEQESSSSSSSCSTSEESREPSPKLLCTSPQHALCPEDVCAGVPQQPAPAACPIPDCPNESLKGVDPTAPDSNLSVPSISLSAPDVNLYDDDSSSDSEPANDYLDEEDVDSGFISNSIESSSDDEEAEISNIISCSSNNTISNPILNSPRCVSVTSSLDKLSLDTAHLQNNVFNYNLLNNSASLPTESTLTSTADKPSISLESFSSLNKGSLPSCSMAFSSHTVSFDLSSNMNTALMDPTSSNSMMEILDINSDSQLSPVARNVSQSFASSTSTSSEMGGSKSSKLAPFSEVISSLDPSLSHHSSNYSQLSSGGTFDGSCNSNTSVTNSYQGSITTQVYDQSYQSTEYHQRLYQHTSPANIPPNTSWSCNFYETSPPSNKYMEIQTTNVSSSQLMLGATSSQPIQCDANGKSYMDLGSTSPYTYSRDCPNNYTLSPSNNVNKSYQYNNQSNSLNNTYNNNPNQQQFYRSSSYGQYNNNGNYFSNSNENYTNSYETTESACSYNSYNSVSPYVSRSRAISRCNVPNCDVTRFPKRPCYPNHRMSVLNISMFKLGRFSKCPDPNLIQSVLICNTLRHIEKDLESEGTNMNALLAHQHMMHQQSIQAPSLLSVPAQPPLCPTPPILPHGVPASPPPPSPLPEGPLPSMHPPMMNIQPLPCTTSPPPLLGPPYNSQPYRNNPQLHYSSMDHVSYDGALYSNLSSGLSDQSHSNSPTIVGCLNSSVSPIGSAIESSHMIVSHPSVIPPPLVSPAGGNSPSLCIPATSDDRHEGSINWGSVLSIPTQSEIDMLHSSEFSEWASDSNSIDMDFGPRHTLLTNIASGPALNTSNSDEGTSLPGTSVMSSRNSMWKTLPSLSAEDVLRTFPTENNINEKTGTKSENVDHLMNVLVQS